MARNRWTRRKPFANAWGFWLWSRLVGDKMLKVEVRR